MRQSPRALGQRVWRFACRTSPYRESRGRSNGGVALSVMAAALAVSAGAEGQAPARRLPLDQALVDTLAPGQRHHWSVAADSGQALRVAIHQRGIDVAVSLLDAQGLRVATFDQTLADGTEAVAFVATTAGPWTLVVWPFDEQAPGEYAVEPPTIGPATDSDRAAMALEMSTEGNRHYNAGRYPEAEYLYGRALQLWEASIGVENSDGALALHNLGVLYGVQRRFDEALPPLELSLQVSEALSEPDRLLIPETLRELGLVTFNLGRQDEAESFWRRALQARESALGPAHPSVAGDAYSLGSLYIRQGRFAEAEPLLERSVTLYESAGVPDLDLARSLHALGVAQHALARYEGARVTLERALAIREQILGPDHLEVGETASNLAQVHQDRGRYEEALALSERALGILETNLGPDHPELSTPLLNHGGLLRDRGDLAGADSLLTRALRIDEQALGPEDSQTARGLNALGALRELQGRYSEAEDLHARALSARETSLGSAHPDVAVSLSNLAGVLFQLGRYDEARPLYERSLPILETTRGPDHPNVATVLNNLAAVREAQGDWEEALALDLRALAIREAALGPDHPDVAMSRNNLGTKYQAGGRNREAEAEFRRALAIWEAARGPDHQDVALALLNLGNLYEHLDRRGEAADLFLRAVTINETALGPTHPYVAAGKSQLSSLYRYIGDLAQAERLMLEALAIWEGALGPSHPQTARARNDLAAMYGEERHAEAEALYQRAIRDLEAALGPEDVSVALVRRNLAQLYQVQGRFAEALAEHSLAIQIQEAAGVEPVALASGYYWRGRVRRELDDTAGAMSDFETAIATGEDLRLETGGGEDVRAGFFRRYHGAYGQMIELKIRSGDLESAFSYAERGRARTLLDQIALGGVDLLADIEPGRRAELEARDTQARARKAAYAQRLTSLQASPALEEPQQRRQLEATRDSLRMAEAEFVQVYNEIKSESPTWRRSRGTPLSLEVARSRVVPDGGLLLIYHLGESEGYLLIVPPAGAGTPQAVELHVGEAEAEPLGLDPGPLTSDAVQGLFADQENGLLAALGTGTSRSRRLGGGRASDVERLHAAWRVLMPESLWSEVASASEVIIVPDRALHHLPFQALVVDPGQDPGETRYWLDVGPPVRYAPSATVLNAILERPPSQGGLGILSVSDPIYDPLEAARAGQLAGGSVTASGSADDMLVPDAGATDEGRAAFERTGASLARLPGTAEESAAIAEVYGQDASAGGVTLLQGIDATEAAVRASLQDPCRGRPWSGRTDSCSSTRSTIWI